MGPVLDGIGSTDYERYLKTDALLSLQVREPDKGPHDQLMFQVLHQSFELWLKVLSFEVATVVDLVQKSEIKRAKSLLIRCARIMETNTAALNVLSTMRPSDFRDILPLLGTGSGAESPGFRWVLATAPKLWNHVESLIKAQGRNLEEIYSENDSNDETLALLEAIMDFDQSWHLWRQVHLVIAKRFVGRERKTLKGYNIMQLEEDIHGVLFPNLWAIRSKMLEDC